MKRINCKLVKTGAFILRNPYCFLLILFGVGAMGGGGLVIIPSP